MAYTQADLDALKAAFATGSLEVWHNNRRVTFQKPEDMERIISAIERELTPPSQRVRRFRWVSSKGL